MKYLRTTLAALALASVSPLLWAQQAAPTTTANAQIPWAYKTQNLSKTQVDELLKNPKNLLIIDVRRPDELTKYGSFQVYLNVQIKDLPQVLDSIPKDRQILTVSNRAHRAGEAGDLLSSKGYKVAGATGSEDYREAGGTIFKVVPPAPATPK